MRIQKLKSKETSTTLLHTESSKQMIKIMIPVLTVEMSKAKHLIGDGLLKLKMLNGRIMIREEDSKLPNCVQIHQRNQSPKR